MARSSGSRFRAGAAALGVVFALSAVVQWNDPDPLAWIALYGLAAALSFAASAGRVPFAPNAAAAILFAVLTLLWAPSLVDARFEAFTHVRMAAARDEAPRETIGLALCAAWTATLAFRARRRKA